MSEVPLLDPQRQCGDGMAYRGHSRVRTRTARRKVLIDLP